MSERIFGEHFSKKSGSNQNQQNYRILPSLFRSAYTIAPILTNFGKSGRLANLLTWYSFDAEIARRGRGPHQLPTTLSEVTQQALRGLNRCLRKLRLPHPSNALIQKPPVGEVFRIIYIPKIDDDRTGHFAFQAIEIKRPELLPLGYNDQGV